MTTMKYSSSDRFSFKCVILVFTILLCGISLVLAFALSGDGSLSRPNISSQSALSHMLRVNHSYSYYRHFFHVFSDEDGVHGRIFPPAAPAGVVSTTPAQNSIPYKVTERDLATAYSGSWPLVHDLFMDARGHVIAIVNGGGGGAKVDKKTGVWTWNTPLYSGNWTRAVLELRWQLVVEADVATAGAAGVASSSSSTPVVISATRQPQPFASWCIVVDFGVVAPLIKAGHIVRLRNELVEYPARVLRDGVWRNVMTRHFEANAKKKHGTKKSKLKRLELVAALLMSNELDDHEMYLRRWLQWHCGSDAATHSSRSSSSSSSSSPSPSSPSSSLYSRYARRIKVDHVLVYVNRPEANNASYMEALQAAYDRRLVTFISFHFRHDLQFADQLPQVNHALYSVKGVAKWLLVSDVDEYLLSKRHVAHYFTSCRAKKKHSVVFADYRVIVAVPNNSNTTNNTNDHRNNKTEKGKETKAALLDVVTISKTATYAPNVRKGKAIHHVDTTLSTGVHVTVHAMTGQKMIESNNGEGPEFDKLHLYVRAKEAKLIHFKRTLFALCGEHGDAAFRAVLKQFYGA